MKRTFKQLVDLYRDDSGYAVITDGINVFELSGVYGYRPEDGEEVAQFIRANFRRVRLNMKSRWQRELAQLRTEYTQLVRALERDPRTAIKALLKRGWGETWGALRVRLHRLLGRSVSRAECKTLRDTIWAMRALRWMLAGTVEVYDLDRPLRFRWTGPNLNTTQPMPFRRGGYPY